MQAKVINSLTRELVKRIKASEAEAQRAREILTVLLQEIDRLEACKAFVPCAKDK